MSVVRSAQTDMEIATELFESLQPENDAPLANLSPEELVEELNSANTLQISLKAPVLTNLVQDSWIGLLLLSFWMFIGCTTVTRN